jgi:hypothetical protein
MLHESTLQFKKTDRNVICMVCYVSILRLADNRYKVRLAVKIKEYISEKKIKKNLVLRFSDTYCYIYEVSLDTQQYLSNNNLNKQQCYAGNNRQASS